MRDFALAPARSPHLVDIRMSLVPRVAGLAIAAAWTAFGLVGVYSMLRSEPPTAVFGLLFIGIGLF